MLHSASMVMLLVGLLLESALLAQLWQHRHRLRLRVFGLLLLFYLVRSLALFGTARSLTPLSREELSALLAVVDVVLQLALGCALVLRSDGSKATHANGVPEAAFLLPVNLLLASGLTLALVHLLPQRSPVPFDRGSALCAFFFLGLLAFVRRRSEPGDFFRLVLQGFAALGVADLIGQSGKVLAGWHREPGLYLCFAYLEGAVWLLVLAVWVMRLWHDGSEPKHTPWRSRRGASEPPPFASIS